MIREGGRPIAWSSEGGRVGGRVEDGGGWQDGEEQMTEEMWPSVIIVVK